jgi:ABC-2 type transport system ATP-binding protein
VEDVIVTQRLTKYFSGKKVVDRLDLRVPRGAIYALLGDNGAGKSTTIRMLTGLLAADAGRASILGQDCWSRAIELRHRVGYVPERPRFYDWMTVREIGTFTAGFHRPGYAVRYLSLLERFRLEPGAKLKNLSKGGYAKVGLALALASDPEVLILDEPTSGLDLFIRREFLGSMIDLAGEGRTILISSHGIAEVERVASHVAFLANGELLLAGPLDELRERLVRVRVRQDGVGTDLYDPAGLGLVLEYEASGRHWQAVIQDPDRTALEDLHQRPGVIEVDKAGLTLEEMYTALLARFHRPGPMRNGEWGMGNEDKARGAPGEGTSAASIPHSPFPIPHSRGGDRP